MRPKIRLRELILIISAFFITMVGIKASDYLSNQKTKNSLTSLCPPEMVFVESAQGGFCLDKYEASPSDKCPEKNPSSPLDTRLNLSTPDCQPVSRPQTKPWTNISRDQAAQACAKAGKRLPTAAEWHLASLGTPDKNTGWGEADCQVNNNWPYQPGLTGTGINCRSAAGAYDLIGNVWEWTSDEVKDGVYQGRILPAEGYIQAMSQDGLPIQTDEQTGNPDYHNDYFWLKGKGIRAIMCGGYWQNQAKAGAYATYAVSYPSFAGSAVGFRCLKRPKF